MEEKETLKAMSKGGFFMNIFWLLQGDSFLAGGGWLLIYFSWWWVVVGGGGWWWVVVDRGGLWHSLV